MGRTVPRWSPPPQKKKRPIEISETTTALYHGSAAAGRHLFRASHLTPLSGFFLFCFWRFFISLFISSLLGHFRRSAGPPDGIISLLTIHRCVVLLLRFVFELLRRQRRTAVFRVFHRSVFTIFYSELFGTERLQKGRSPVPSRENRRRVLFSFFLFFVQPIFAFAKPRFKEPPRDAEVSMPPIYFYFSLHFCTLQRSMLSPPRGATPRKRWRSHWEAMIHGALGFFFDFCRQKFILTGFSPFLWSYLD